MQLHAHERSRRTAAGFTLIELMIVVAIVAILAAIAVPLYNQQIRESRRTDARTAVLDAAANEERYYTANNTYISGANNLGYSSASPTVGSGYYTLTVLAPTPATGFIATATPVAGTSQAADTSCQSFSVDNTGAQSSTDGSGNDTTSTCWK